MFEALVVAAAFAAPAAEKVPDFSAVQWWNSIPLTVEQLRGRTIFVESFRTW